ncbi:MAG: patatin-like phospholipase family protein [Terrimicrobiaceae bacterium]|nr:patatin-like phospholipase family protein [Terrimicrobiaceae bacterium]
MEETAQRNGPGSAEGSGIGLCLGSSYFGFYAHAGFLKGLFDAGIRPAHIAGCSSGAIVGGLYAAGHHPNSIIDRLLSFDFASAFFEMGVPLRGMAMLASLPGVSGFLTGRKFMRLLREFVGDRRIEDLRAPRFSVSATNLTACRSEVLESGALAQCIAASSAVPMLFSAIPLNGSFYWDGGIANSLPFDCLCDDPGIHTIIVHRILHSHEVRARGRRGAPSIATAFNIAHQSVGERILELDSRRLALSGRRLIYCQTVTSVPAFGRKRRARYVQAGLSTAQARAGDWRALAEGTVSLTPQIAGQ